MRKLTEEQMIEHMVLNVPNMSKFSFVMMFGMPEVNPPSLMTLQAQARKVLESGFLDIRIAYDDMDGNEELVTPLPDSLQ